MSNWSRAEVGAVVPPLTRIIDLPDMVAYAGATWDWHRLHYDPEFAAAIRLPGPVVDGQLFGALLVEMIQDWLGPCAFVQKLDFRFASIVFAGETVRCEGEVTALSTDSISLALRVIAGQPERIAVSPASAVVRQFR